MNEDKVFRIVLTTKDIDSLTDVDPTFDLERVLNEIVEQAKAQGYIRFYEEEV